ncbi:MAG: ADP-ribosylglycohydrolase family protein, partial [Planctomycetota bacterium]
MVEKPTLKERIFGGLLASVLGDALGLPREGAAREWLDEEPVKGLSGGGPHRQRAGAWSDDGAMLLCVAESLCEDYDVDDVGAKFLSW